MRFVGVAVLVAALFGCNHEPSLDAVQAPKGWTRLSPEDAGHDRVIARLGLEYRERKTMVIDSYASPKGDQLRVVRVQTQYDAMSLMSRIAHHRGPGIVPLEQVGALLVEGLDTPQGRHYAFTIEPERSNDPGKVDRAALMIASCLIPAGADRDPDQRIREVRTPCERSLDAAVLRAVDEADGSWMYGYLGALAVITLVIGRKLQIGRRLLPPRGSSGLPTAQLRRGPMS